LVTPCKQKHAPSNFGRPAQHTPISFTATTQKITALTISSTLTSGTIYTMVTGKSFLAVSVAITLHSHQALVTFRTHQTIFADEPRRTLVIADKGMKGVEGKQVGKLDAAGRPNMLTTEDRTSVG
jgi:hypothetical protein